MRPIGHDHRGLDPQVAFTAQYDGNTEVFVVPADGGEPKRLTYTATLGRDEVSDRMGPNNIVMGWTPDGKNVLFRSRMRSFNDFIGQLFTVPVAGGLPEPLPLPRGGFASYTADGGQLVFNRVFREFRTWKRYRGGMADDVWLYDFATKKTEQLTDDPAQDIFPMVVGGKVYFISDRGKEMRYNLYTVDPKTKKVDRLTDFTEFDIKFPSAGDKAIVFENGGYLYRFDPAVAKAEKVPVRILEDRVGARGALTDVSKQVTASELSPDGKRFSITFTVEEGPRYQVADVAVNVGDAQGINLKLLRQGVIVRPVAMPGFLRVTVGLPSENARFLEALDKALHG